MFAEILNTILRAFAVVFQVFKGFFVWIFDHTWAFVLSIFLPLMKLINTVIETVKNWLGDTIDSVFGESSYSFDSFFDLIDSAIINLFGDDIASMIFKDVIYVFNFSSFVENCVTLVIPLLLSCIIYKVVKSWIPTVSGS